MLGVIGGSGLYELVKGSQSLMKKHYGETTVTVGEISGSPCAFIARHGKDHSIPPHRINHKANLHTLHELKATDVLAISSVGAISDYAVGDLVLVRDFISFYAPPQTFFDDFSGGLKHTDMSEPYSGELSERARQAAAKCGVGLRDGGILAHTLGPRFETKAEVRALKTLGANLVGMTSSQEAILANELGMRFANIAVVSNQACGISQGALSSEESIKVARGKEAEIRKIISELVKTIPE